MRTKGDGGKAERTGGSSTARGIVMYLGPSVHGIIQSGTSYKNGLPPKAAALAALHPVFLELFVPVDGPGQGPGKNWRSREPAARGL